MSTENRIDYVEIPVTDVPRARAFLEAMFGWTFREWGDDYLSFSDGRLNGGVRKADEPAPATGVLLVFYSADLERDVTNGMIVTVVDVDVLGDHKRILATYIADRFTAELRFLLGELKYRRLSYVGRNIALPVVRWGWRFALQMFFCG